MAIIVIKDLPESVELDRLAMLAIAGGSRFRSRATDIGRTAFRGKRIVDFSSSRAGKPSPEAHQRPAARPPSK